MVDWPTKVSCDIGRACALLVTVLLFACDSLASESGARVQEDEVAVEQGADFGADPCDAQERLSCELKESSGVRALIGDEGQACVVSRSVRSSDLSAMPACRDLTAFRRSISSFVSEDVLPMGGGCCAECEGSFPWWEVYLGISENLGEIKIAVSECPAREGWPDSRFGLGERHPSPVCRCKVMVDRLNRVFQVESEGNVEFDWVSDRMRERFERGVGINELMTDFLQKERAGSDML